jgi:hypothetical protein
MVTGHLIFYYFPFLKECFKNVSSFHLTFSDQCSSVEIGIKCAKPVRCDLGDCVGWEGTCISLSFSYLVKSIALFRVLRPRVIVGGRQMVVWHFQSVITTLDSC